MIVYNIETLHGYSFESTEIEETKEMCLSEFMSVGFEGYLKSLYGTERIVGGRLWKVYSWRDASYTPETGIMKVYLKLRNA